MPKKAQKKASKKAAAKAATTKTTVKKTKAPAAKVVKRRKARKAAGTNGAGHTTAQAKNTVARLLLDYGREPIRDLLDKVANELLID